MKLGLGVRVRRWRLLRHPPPGAPLTYASTPSPGVMENPLARAGGVMMPVVAARILSLVAGSGALVNVSPSVRRQATTHGWAQ